MSGYWCDTTFAQLVRLATGHRFLQFPEEQANFQLPEAYAKTIQAAKEGRQITPDDSHIVSKADDKSDSDAVSNDRAGVDADGDAVPDEKARQDSEGAADDSSPKILPDGTILVDWYGPNDPADPQNWSSTMKFVPSIVIILYTFAVYLGSSIFTSSYGGVIERFGVSEQVVSLNLSMYVLAYGLGPMLWSPLSEIPSIGRGPPYIITFALFVILCVPTALTTNFAGLVVLRFLLGFFGSPCLATGAASLGDLYPFSKLPYAISLWAFFATSGPALAPMISGFSVPAEGWRWSTWELLWLSGPVLIAMFFLVPETFPPTILHRRAKRLRALTGVSSVKSQSEIDQSHMNAYNVVIESLWRPVETMIFDPSIAFTALYTALIYGIYYSFFECFPIVYGEGGHNFNLGVQGLIYLSIGIGVFIAMVSYWVYIRLVVEPAILSNNLGPPERRLIPALFASFLLPIGLFMFAWTSPPNIPWIVPTIGVSILSAGIFVILQCIFLYLPLSYPMYAASLFAGNDFTRSTLAAGTIHFSQPLYHNLGVPKGVTLLAGLTAGCIGGVFVLYFYGATLRARSRFAPK